MCVLKSIRRISCVHHECNMCSLNFIVISEYKNKSNHAVNWSTMNIHCKMKSSPRNKYISILLKTLWICHFLFFIFFFDLPTRFFEKKIRKPINKKKKCLIIICPIYFGSYVLITFFTYIGTWEVLSHN